MEDLGGGNARERADTWPFFPRLECGTPSMLDTPFAPTLDYLLSTCPPRVVRKMSSIHKTDPPN